MIIYVLDVSEEEWRDWIGSTEPTESRSTLNKDHIFLNLTFVLQQVTCELRQRRTGVSRCILDSHLYVLQLGLYNMCKSMETPVIT